METDKDEQQFAPETFQGEASSQKKAKVCFADKPLPDDAAIVKKRGPLMCKCEKGPKKHYIPYNVK